MGSLTRASSAQRSATFSYLTWPRIWSPTSTSMTLLSRMSSLFSLLAHQPFRLLRYKCLARKCGPCGQSALPVLLTPRVSSTMRFPSSGMRGARWRLHGAMISSRVLPCGHLALHHRPAMHCMGWGATLSHFPGLREWCIVCSLYVGILERYTRNII